MADIKEADNVVKVSWGLLLYAAAGIIFTTASIVSVFWRFSQSELELKELIDKIEYVNERIDKKYERQQGYINELDIRIKELEKPNSDE